MHAEQTPFEYQTLADDKWTCGRVGFSRRRENLSFAHHVEVAALALHAAHGGMSMIAHGRDRCGPGSLTILDESVGGSLVRHD